MRIAKDNENSLTLISQEFAKNFLKKAAKIMRIGKDNACKVNENGV